MRPHWSVYNQLCTYDTVITDTVYIVTYCPMKSKSNNFSEFLRIARNWNPWMVMPTYGHSRARLARLAGRMRPRGLPVGQRWFTNKQ